MVFSELEHLPPFLMFSPNDFQYTCIFPIVNDGFRRCQSTVNKEDRIRAAELRISISKLDPSENSLIELLQNYAKLCCCKRSHRKRVNNGPLVEALSRRWAQELCSVYTLEGKPDEQSVVFVAASRSTTISIVEQQSSPGQDGIVVSSNIDSAVKVVPPPCYTKQERDITIGTEEGRTLNYSERFSIAPPGIKRRDIVIKEYKPPDDSMRTRSATGSLAWEFSPFIRYPEETVLSCLQRRLDEEDSKVGQLYIYTRDSDPGYAKIGYTTRSVQYRLGQWREKCNYKPTLVHQVDGVPNAKRVESLVHQELSPYRRLETICKHNQLCSGRHQEWFEISIAAAAAVVDACAKWMCEAEPYNDEGFLQEEWARRFERSSSQLVSVGGLQLQLYITGSNVSLREDTSLPVSSSASLILGEDAALPILSSASLSLTEDASLHLFSSATLSLTADASPPVLSSASLSLTEDLSPPISSPVSSSLTEDVALPILSPASLSLASGDIVEDSVPSQNSLAVVTVETAKPPELPARSQRAIRRSHVVQHHTKEPCLSTTNKSFFDKLRRRAAVLALASCKLCKAPSPDNLWLDAVMTQGESRQASSSIEVHNLRRIRGAYRKKIGPCLNEVEDEKQSLLRRVTRRFPTHTMQGRNEAGSI